MTQLSNPPPVIAPLDLKHVVCPQCRESFVLRWEEYTMAELSTSDYERPITLLIRGCPSGGVYDVSIHCPHCDYEEDL